MSEVGDVFGTERPDVEALAHAARIALDEEELAALPAQLEQVLELFAQLADVDVQGVEPLVLPLARGCALRDDVVAVGEGGATAEAVIGAAEPSQLAEHDGASLFSVPTGGAA
ncbi:MAG: Asp-tRNA(Asn)/Glu-tRNA(Gln) amidotransferase GatCAB subunit C [Proteobacteria bacterium]|nr:MAG: Asp-tRNA(Asn)/Glu-tRNA(Gln) amidotransferase GatCAB subunit C [Pseudomonadota bacterium]